MIIIMGDSPKDEQKAVEYLRSQRLYQELDLVEYHVWIADCRSQEQLDERLAEILTRVNVKKRLAETPLSYDNYLLRLKYLAETHGADWFINDIRPLWFWADFSKLVDRCQIIAIFADSKAEASKHLPNDTLLLKSFDEAKISAYLSGKPETDVSE